MKRTAVALTLLIILGAAGAGAYWHFSKPSTPAEALAEAAKKQTRLQEKLDLERVGSNPDAQKIAEQEITIRKLWAGVIEDWPGSEEADVARLRLLERDLDQEEDPQARIELIEAFLEANPEHDSTKDLIWQKAELLRDELEDPLGAIAVFEEIEVKFPDDPIAAKAALASAKIYEDVDEHGAAARAYARIAEDYPSSPEAEQSQMRQAALLEGKLDQKRAAEKIYREVAAKNPTGAAGREAKRRSEEISGDLAQDEQDKYYQDTYQVEEQDLYQISHEELNSPTRKRIRAQGLDIEHYDITLKLDPVNSTMELTAIIRGELRDQLEEPLILELSPALEIDHIDLVFGGKGGPASLKFSKRGPFVEMILVPLEGDPPYAIELEFEASGETNGGLGASVTQVGGSLHTESHWYPFTAFGDNATKRISVIAPDNYTAVAQGRQETSEAWEAGEEGEEGEEVWRRTTFVQDRPTPNITVAIGEYVSLIHEGPDGLPIEVYVREENKETAEGIWESLENAVEILSEILGPFPYSRLALAEVPDFPGGYGPASLILLGSPVFNGLETPDKFIAHETAHQWWGNLIGLDLQEGSIPWLSESFATYMDAIYTERTQGTAAFRTQIRTMGNFYRSNAVQFEDRPIAETLWLNGMYRSLMYEKGALVLHSLRRELGDEAFFKLLKDFVADHRDQIVNVDMFAAAATEAAGEPMEWFFDQMLNRTGYAHVTIEKAAGQRSRIGWVIDLELTQPEDAIYRMTMDVEVATEDGETETHEVKISTASDRVTINALAKPLSVRLDPDNWHLIDARPGLIEAEVTFNDANVAIDEVMRVN